VSDLATLWGGGGGDIDGRWPLLSVLDLEFDSLVLGKSLESLLLDGAEVNEDILGAVAGRDEAETLGLVEPLDLSLDFVRHSDECGTENCCGGEVWFLEGLRMSVSRASGGACISGDGVGKRRTYIDVLARGWYFKGVKYCRVEALIKEV
jgi:hypothetical protein